MTVIAYRDGVMAADSVGWTCNSSIKTPVAPKIKRMADGGLFGCCGYSPLIAKFSSWMLSGMGLPGKFDKSDQFEALWAKPDGSLWMCDYTLEFYPLLDDFFAIGMPIAFVFGAMHAGATAEFAVRLAVLHTDGAGGAVQVERIGA